VQIVLEALALVLKPHDVGLDRFAFGIVLLQLTKDKVAAKIEAIRRYVDTSYIAASEAYLILRLLMSSSRTSLPM